MLAPLYYIFGSIQDIIIQMIIYLFVQCNLNILFREMEVCLSSQDCQAALIDYCVNSIPNPNIKKKRPLRQTKIIHGSVDSDYSYYAVSTYLQSLNKLVNEKQ